jgi:hypothetical protein
MIMMFKVNQPHTHIQIFQLGKLFTVEDKNQNIQDKTIWKKKKPLKKKKSSKACPEYHRQLREILCS